MPLVLADGRNFALKERALRSVRKPDTWTESLRAESMAASAGQPAVIREAMWRAHYYRGCPVVIHPGELVVGDYPRTETRDVQTPQIFGRQDWQAGRSWQIPGELEKYFQREILSWAGNHKTLDYDTVFSIGFSGLRDRIAERIERLDPAESAFDE